MTRRLRRMAVAAMLGLGAISLVDIAAHAEPGVFDDRIVFGQSAAFEGPAAALGLAMREGILAALNEANATGGVNGHRLELSRRRIPPRGVPYCCRRESVRHP